MLAEAKPEIVIIATPDHWHALQSIACCQAGAHVLVEKPTGHTIGEDGMRFPPNRGGFLMPPPFGGRWWSRR